MLKKESIYDKTTAVNLLSGKNKWVPIVEENGEKWINIGLSDIDSDP